MKSIEVRDVSQIAAARRAAAALARSHDFGEEDAGRVAIVATELSSNLVKHGGGGEIIIGVFDDRTGAGIELLALDKGVGMADVSSSSRDGHSTAGSPGTGLGAIRRGSHYSDVYSVPGRGTAAIARLQIGQPKADKADIPEYGTVSIAFPGEEACGDAWCRHVMSDGMLLLIADGLGHGPQAAEASQAAVRSFHSTLDREPSAGLEAMHAALRPTRGAAIAIARLDYSEQQVRFAGVGNIAGTIVGADGRVQRMVSNNGTVGHVARRIRDFDYALEARSLVILASDGLGTSWRLKDYPGLVARHPTLIAGVLYRDFNRGRDDVTVMVARGFQP